MWRIQFFPEQCEMGKPGDPVLLQCDVNRGDEEVQLLISLIDGKYPANCNTKQNSTRKAGHAKITVPIPLPLPGVVIPVQIESNLTQNTKSSAVVTYSKSIDPNQCKRMEAQPQR